MQLRGEELRKIRRKRGLSQTALAEGICTQATISLMEKQNRIPKMNILTAICARLDIKTYQIIKSDDVSLTSIFDETSILLVHDEYEAARKELKKIKVKQLSTDVDKQLYYYLLGRIQVASGQVDEAIFNFELVLTQFSTTSANIYLAMTTVGMALAYEKRGNKERAQRFTMRAVNLIDDKQLIGGKQRWVILYHDITSLYLRLGQYKAALQTVNRGIRTDQADSSLFLLDDLYEMRGQAELGMHENAQAKQDLQIADSLSIIMQNDDRTARLDKQLAAM